MASYLFADESFHMGSSDSQSILVGFYGVAL